MGVWQDFEAKGGKVVVPVGCNGLEDWLLDNVEVSKLMPLLKKGAANDRQCLRAHLRLSWQYDHQATQLSLQPS